MNTEFACDMTALNAQQRRRHGELAARLRPKLARIIELDDGYRLRLKSEMGDDLAEFARLESLCCPFFKLQVSNHHGSSELSVTGPGDIKPFIRAEFGIPGG